MYIYDNVAEIAIPSSVPEELPTVISDSLPPATDVRGLSDATDLCDGLSDAEKKKDELQLDKR